MKKFMLRVLPVILVALVWLPSLTPTFAVSTNGIDNMISNGSGSNSLSSAVSNIWATIATVLQILAIAAIVFAGVRYMFAGADEKAEIKNGLIALAIGAVLVFGATTVVKLISNVASDVANSSNIT